MVPYPVIRGDYFANIGFWWDFEFWNRSVDREATAPNEFSGTPPGSFPKLDLRFDPQTGLANYDLDSYVAQAAADARFHVKGRAADDAAQRLDRLSRPAVARRLGLVRPLPRRLDEARAARTDPRVREPRPAHGGTPDADA